MDPSTKWNYRKYITLQNLLSAHYCLPLWYMAKTMFLSVVKNKKTAPFSSGIYVLTIWIYVPPFITSTKSSFSFTTILK